MKRTIPQSVFDSPEARKAQRDGHRQACAELAATPRHKLNKGNPNHTDYDATLFGYSVPEFMMRQYK